MTIKESRDVCLSGVVTLSDSPRTTDSHRVAKHFSWCLRQESNLYLALRRRLFYPLNYGGWYGQDSRMPPTSATTRSCRARSRCPIAREA